MRPLLLHASSPSSSPEHRRVIHLDFASEDLPGGLMWEAVGTAQAGIRELRGIGGFWEDYDCESMR